MGGRDFDVILAEHFAAEFASKYGKNVDANTNPKAMVCLIINKYWFCYYYFAICYYYDWQMANVKLMSKCITRHCRFSNIILASVIKSTTWFSENN